MIRGTPRMTLPFDLYLVVSGGEPELERAIAALRTAPSGRVAVQARWKDEPDAVVLSRTARLRIAAAPQGIPVLVSGRPDLARAAGASGVHLPERGGGVHEARAALCARALVGASCHERIGVLARAEEGADFVTLGPIGEVPNKGPALDAAAFGAIARTVATPVLALGGVLGGRDVARVMALGARGIAVQRAICAAAEPEVALRALLDALDAARPR